MNFPARPALRDALASPESKRLYVRRLFSTIADRYDFITGLLSYGQDRRWKRRIADLSAAAPGSFTRLRRTGAALRGSRVRAPR
jgi:hypothetical protein